MEWIFQAFFVSNSSLVNIFLKFSLKQDFKGLPLDNTLQILLYNQYIPTFLPDVSLTC